MIDYNILFYILISPLAGCVILFFIPSNKHDLLKKVALSTSFFSFIFSLLLWILFDENCISFQFICNINSLSLENIKYSVGVDGISLFFIILTTFLIPLCILISWDSINTYVKEYLVLFLLIETVLLNVFSVLDLLLFYIFFESVLIPIFIIIGVWGSYERKIKASYYFFFYTLISSFLILLAIVLTYFQVGTTDIQILYNTQFSVKKQILLWIAFFIIFAVKIPIIPFHIWLPEAHAEAPTAGSVVLAGILLKMGGYGFLRFSIPLLPDASIYFSPIVFVLSIIAIVYASLSTLRQIDLKKIIAYSSIAHIGYVTLGIFSFNVQGIEGSILLILGHGLISSALFLCVGILYEKYKTRVLKYYSGLIQIIPLFVTFFLFFLLANIGFPGTSNFIGEFLVLIGISQINYFVTIFAVLGIVFSAAYSLWLFNHVSGGLIKLHYLQNYYDISKREFFILLFLFFSSLWIGILPNSFLKPLHNSTFNLMSHIIFS
uniref:NADH-ubiquinone oxidoreductase chain 4 n=1 Tax=Cyanidium caldarium TaxID=2771 RepID=A0A7H0WBA3_CYACA|nr:NADH dehydrogenase subunit 4 [Cyanidium caldarium]QNR39832.1 NADH dehydrogenase subunit 4 [Cyanidium caldarium]